MKIRFNYIFIVVLYCYANTIAFAQEQVSECEFSFNKALYILKGNGQQAVDLNRAKEVLAPCIKLGDARAQLLLGRILKGENTEKSDIEAFKNFKKSAKQGNSIAMADLGVMYKYGRGCDVNYKKAKKWFIKSAELGNSKAIYSLGYFYLKGLGEVKQDYIKAINLFRKSDNPMAKYWLGVCYYYGYGVPKNISKAEELLKLPLSEVRSANIDNIEIEQILSGKHDKSEESTDLYAIREFKDLKKIRGVWEGELIFYDWSGKFIENNIPMKMTIYNEKENDEVRIIWDLEGKKQELSYNLINDTLYFDDLVITLPHITFNKRIPAKLSHQILNSVVSLKTVNNSVYLTGSLDSYIVDWEEPAAYSTFVLKQKLSYLGKIEEVKDNEFLEGIPKVSSFVRLFPNPFEDDLVISYSLSNQKSTEVTVTSLFNGKTTVVKPLQVQYPGEYKYVFSGSGLRNGMYIVSVKVDGKENSRIVVKR